MKYSPVSIGIIVQKTRKSLRVTQKDLALTSGTGQRFISDLENGKTTCHLGKTLIVLQTLGIKLSLQPPVSDQSNGQA